MPNIYANAMVPGSRQRAFSIPEIPRAEIIARILRRMENIDPGQLDPQTRDLREDAILGLREASGSAYGDMEAPEAIDTHGVHSGLVKASQEGVSDEEIAQQLYDNALAERMAADTPLEEPLGTPARYLQRTGTPEYEAQARVSLVNALESGPDGLNFGLSLDSLKNLPTPALDQAWVNYRDFMENRDPRFVDKMQDVSDPFLPRPPTRGKSRAAYQRSMEREAEPWQDENFMRELEDAISRRLYYYRRPRSAFK